jgi:hypothetical protein
MVPMLAHNCHIMFCCKCTMLRRAAYFPIIVSIIIIIVLPTQSSSFPFQTEEREALSDEFLDNDLAAV